MTMVSMAISRIKHMVMEAIAMDSSLAIEIAKAIVTTVHRQIITMEIVIDNASNIT